MKTPHVIPSVKLASFESPECSRSHPSMKKAMALASLTIASSPACADEPARIINAINAVYDAREALKADLLIDNPARDEIAACPPKELFAKILRDEKTYNTAVKAFWIEWNTP